MEGFSDLPRKEKLRVFRIKAQQMQACRQARETNHVIGVARKMGKEDQLKMRVQFACINEIDKEQCDLWKRVLEDSRLVSKKGETIMTVMEN